MTDAPPAAARVAVAEGNARYRRELTALLAADRRFDVVGTAGDGAGALDLVRRRAPDVVVLDAALAPSGAAGLVAALLDERPETRVLVLSATAEDVAAAAALRAGARGHVARDVDPGRLLEAIDLVGRGAVLHGEADALSHVYPADEQLTFVAAGGGDPAPGGLAAPEGPEGAAAAIRVTGLGTAAAEAGLLAVVAGEAAACTLSRVQARQLRERRPADARAYRVGQLAAVLARQDRADADLVRLALLVDRGEDADERWQAQPERYDGLPTLLAAVPERVLVLLGEPGAGKTTLLRNAERAEAIDGLRGDTERLTLAASLGDYACAPGGQPPEPGAWLAGRWAERCPDLPPLGALLAEGRVLVLLDGLNEMPVRNQAERRRAVEAWRRFAVALAAGPAGNRMVVSCRRLDYSQPLSSAELRVPQVQIEPLSDEQVRAYLEARAPEAGRAAWRRLADGPELNVLRTPFYLNLFADRIDRSRELPPSRAALSTAFVREALRREVERHAGLFAQLLAERDVLQLARDRWASEWELPQAGPLVASLSRLAYRMQSQWDANEAAQVHLGLEDAIAAIDDPAAVAVVRAAEALNILDRESRTGEVLFSHQLVQEYFAARELARSPMPERVGGPWRAADVRPSVRDVLSTLPASEALPALSTTGWEETTLLAAEMASEQEAFVQGLMGTDLALAGRAAQLPAVRSRLDEAFVDGLRQGLVDRSRDVAADLRVRIACALAVGDLGDPRFERRAGPDGAFLMPPLVVVPGGAYPIGDDEPIELAVPGDNHPDFAHLPRHTVELAAFEIGQFEVTNAEWACFMASGGYEEERWWDTVDGQRWRRGELPNEGTKFNNRMWRKRLLGDPPLLERMVDEGRFPSAEAIERWRNWVRLDDAAFEAAIAAQWQTRRETEPRHWHDPRFNHPSQPVVGVCWFEARAYCAWLGAQFGRIVRLPTEVEWEAAARGMDGRAFPWGAAPDRLRANTLETRVKRTTPVGVFPDGDSALGVADMGGNGLEWTSSLFGVGDVDNELPEFRYPYDRRDGRENFDAPPDVRRVLRGGGWDLVDGFARTACRDYSLPDDRAISRSVRFVVAPAS